MMYGVRDPFRLDQGDVSFDAPDTLKAAMHRGDRREPHALRADDGLPRLLELLAEKLRRVNGTPIGSPDEVMVTNGGIHALYVLFQALLEPGDEVDRARPGVAALRRQHRSRRAACRCRVRCTRRSAGATTSTSSSRRSRRETRAIYINSPHNPTGGVLTRADVERIADDRARSTICG